MSGIVLVIRARAAERPVMMRRARRRKWRSCAGRVERGEAVDTVKETVVEEGRRVWSWGRVVSIEVCARGVTWLTMIWGKSRRRDVVRDPGRGMDSATISHHAPAHLGVM